MDEREKYLSNFYDRRYKEKAFGRIFRLKNFLMAEHLRIRSRHIDFVLNDLLENEHPRVIDLGAGNSSYANHIEGLVKVDVSADALTDFQGEKYVSDLLKLPEQLQNFDFVICSQVLEHTLNPLAVLDTFKRICANRGYLLITVPNRYALMRTRYFELERKIDTAGHIHEFRESWLNMQLAMRGFRVLRSEGACFDTYAYFAYLERAKKRHLEKKLAAQLSPKWLSKVLDLDSRLNRRRPRGLSLEILAQKCD